MVVFCLQCAFKHKLNKGDFKWFLSCARAIKIFENLKCAIYFINYIVWGTFWAITFKNFHSPFCTMAKQNWSLVQINSNRNISYGRRCVNSMYYIKWGTFWSFTFKNLHSTFCSMAIHNWSLVQINSNRNVSLGCCSLNLIN